METGTYDNRNFSVCFSGMYEVNRVNCDTYNNMGVYFISGLHREISEGEPICYVGSSLNLYGRLFNAHYGNMVGTANDQKNSNIILINSAQKHGIENFKFFVLENGTKESLIEREQNWIDFYSERHGFNCLFNISPIAGKPFVTDEIRKKISERRKGTWAGEKNPKFGSKRFGESNPFYGKTHDEKVRKKLSENMKKRWETGAAKPCRHTKESKEKLRQARLGTKATPEKIAKLSAFFKGRPNEKNRKKIRQLDKNGHFMRLWDSLADVEKNTGISASTIGKCANKRHSKGRPVLFAGGFRWEWPTENQNSQ